MEIFNKKIPVYYTYYSYEDFGRGYIGYRRLRDKFLTPEEEDYKGSYTDTRFNPQHKIILGIYFTKEEAQKAEYHLHKFFSVVRNPHFANKVATGQTGKLNGVEAHSEETKQKIREKAIGRKVSKETVKKLSVMRKGENNSFYGKAHTEEFKNKLSKERIGDKNPSWGSGKKRYFKNENLGIEESGISISTLFNLYPQLKNNYTTQGFSKAFSKGKKQYKDWEIKSIQGNQQPSIDNEIYEGSETR